MPLRSRRNADKETLEDFALKGLHLAKMTGVSTATHAVKDGFLLMHTGVGCKYKAAAQVAQHDWGSHPNRKEAWTQVGEVSLIQGSGARIGPFARSWYERRRPGFMVVVSAYFIELTGDALPDIVRETDGTLPCPMASVATAAPNGGFFDGYMATVLGMAKTLDWTQPATAPTKAAVLGFFFHRYEPDQAADLGVLRTLIAQAGLSAGPIWLSGAPWSELATSPECGVVLTMPYSTVHKRKVKRLLKRRDTVEVDLPMGQGGTARFLRTVVAATGGAEVEQRLADVEAYLAAQRARIAPHLGPLTQGFGEVRVAVFADTPLAVGLVTILRELGLQVPLVGLRDDVLGGKAGFYDAVGKNGVSLAEDCEVLLRPSLRQTRERLMDAAPSRDLHVVIGSSIELDLLAHVPAVRGARQHLALLEAGFPTKNHHATLPLPMFGFDGVLVWAQRIVDAVLAPAIGSRPDA